MCQLSLPIPATFAKRQAPTLSTSGCPHPNNSTPSPWLLSTQLSGLYSNRMHWCTSTRRVVCSCRCQHIVSQALGLKTTLCNLLNRPNVQVALTAQQAANLAGVMAVIDIQQVVVMMNLPLDLFKAGV